MSKIFASCPTDFDALPGRKSRIGFHVVLNWKMRLQMKKKKESGKHVRDITETRESSVERESSEEKVDGMTPEKKLLDKSKREREESNPSEEGRLPENKLLDKLRACRRVRLPRELGKEESREFWERFRLCRRRKYPMDAGRGPMQVQRCQGGVE